MEKTYNIMNKKEINKESIEGIICSAIGGIIKLEEIKKLPEQTYDPITPSSNYLG